MISSVFGFYDLPHKREQLSNFPKSVFGLNSLKYQFGGLGESQLHVLIGARGFRFAFKGAWLAAGDNIHFIVGWS